MSHFLNMSPLHTTILCQQSWPKGCDFRDRVVFNWLDTNYETGS
jgi:hypothetical protein